MTNLKSHMRRHGIMDIKDSVLFRDVFNMMKDTKRKKELEILSLKMEYGSKWSEVLRLKEIDEQQKKVERDERRFTDGR